MHSESGRADFMPLACKKWCTDWQKRDCGWGKPCLLVARGTMFSKLSNSLRVAQSAVGDGNHSDEVIYGTRDTSGVCIGTVKRGRRHPEDR